MNDSLGPYRKDPEDERQTLHHRRKNPHPAEGKLKELVKVLQQREDRVRRTKVRSPVAGSVNKFYMNTIGGVVQPGEPIVDIVPDNETLFVEAKIRPSDIAFLSPV